MRFGGRSPPLSPDPELVRTLARLLAETGLSEIEYAVGGQRIRVARGAALAGNATPAIAPGAAAPAVVETSEHPGALTAPMVGTVYLASEPGAAPFVRLGDAVVAGQTLLIIEAMKVMNEIKAPRAGRVVQIFAADAQPVEYGAALILIE
ncbi:MAG TPA: acetyl-CoA carboxylase biotin carboxyl carrier protein subunit [Stellaceae bacterium]